jgi:hypothetical protein
VTDFPVSRYVGAGATPSEVEALTEAFDHLTPDEQRGVLLRLSSVAEGDLRDELALMRASDAATDEETPEPSDGPATPVEPPAAPVAPPSAPAAPASNAGPLPGPVPSGAPGPAVEAPASS